VLSPQGEQRQGIVQPTDEPQTFGVPPSGSLQTGSEPAAKWLCPEQQAKVKVAKPETIQPPSMVFVAPVVVPPVPPPLLCPPVVPEAEPVEPDPPPAVVVLPDEVPLVAAVEYSALPSMTSRQQPPS